MQSTQTLTTQDLKNLLHKIIGQPVNEEMERPPVPTMTPLVEEVIKVQEAAVVQEKQENAPVEVVQETPIQENTSQKLLKKQLKAVEVEVKQQKETIDELRSALHEAKLELLKKEESLTEKIHESSLDGQEAKSRLVRLLNEKKELEDKLSALSCEKATLAARLQSQKSELVKLEEREALTSEQINEVVNALEETTEKLTERELELQTVKELLKKGEAKAEEYRAKIDELQKERLLAQETALKVEQLEDKLQEVTRSYEQELTLCKALLQEQKEKLAEEQKAHRLLADEHIFMQKRIGEQENHLSLLEQHLARRVKECALSSKQIEDLMDRTTELQNSLTVHTQKVSYLEESLDSARKVENALRIELDHQANMLQDDLSRKDEEIDSLHLHIQKQEQELIQLRKIQAQFSEVEALFKRGSEPKETFSFSPPPLFLSE